MTHQARYRVCHPSSSMMRLTQSVKPRYGSFSWRNLNATISGARSNYSIDSPDNVFLLPRVLGIFGSLHSVILYFLFHRIVLRGRVIALNRQLRCDDLKRAYDCGAENLDRHIDTKPGRGEVLVGREKKPA